MSIINNTKFNKSLLQVVALIGASLPLFTVSFESPAMAQSANNRHCIDVQNSGICAEEKGQGYEFYAQFGPVTSQKQYIGRDGGCATFGTISVAGSHAQVKGCIKGSPVRFEGKAEACAVRRCKSKDFAMNLTGTGNSSNPVQPPSQAPSQIGKYELFWDGVRVGTEPSWTREQAIANLEWNKKSYPNQKVEGFFNGQKIGYELIWDGVRVGFEPSWTREQAIANLEWNKKAYPNKKIEAVFNGEKLL